MCVAEVMRTMHQRAADVRLMPHIQMSCISDLTTYCVDKVEPGEVRCYMTYFQRLVEVYPLSDTIVCRHDKIYNLILSGAKLER